MYIFAAVGYECSRVTWPAGTFNQVGWLVSGVWFISAKYTVSLVTLLLRWQRSKVITAWVCVGLEAGVCVRMIVWLIFCPSNNKYSHIFIVYLDYNVFALDESVCKCYSHMFSALNTVTSELLVEQDDMQEQRSFLHLCSGSCTGRTGARSRRSSAPGWTGLVAPWSSTLRSTGPTDWRSTTASRSCTGPTPSSTSSTAPTWTAPAGATLRHTSPFSPVHKPVIQFNYDLDSIIQRLNLWFNLVYVCNSITINLKIQLRPRFHND